MPGSASSELLDRRPLELAVRALVAFAVVLWLSIQFSPALLDALLPFYERSVEAFDDHYRIDFSLTRVGGHDRPGADLVLLGHATVKRAFVAFGDNAKVMLVPGERLQCSTAIGMLMQPAIVLTGLLMAWPLRCRREVALRGSLGVLLLGLWMLLGIPFWLWISLRDIPIEAFAPGELSMLAAVNKILLNGGAVTLGALLGGAAVAGGRRLSWRSGTA